jgi:L-malate glycosyltransferase
VLRVLFFNYEFPPIGGGGANANAYLFQQFAKESWLTIDCITSALGTRNEVLQYSDNITLHRLAISKKEIHFWTQKEVLAYLWYGHAKATELTARYSYDLCHAFFGFPSGLLAWLRRSRLPYLISLRGSDVPGFNPRLTWQYLALKPLFRRIWKSARFVVTNSIGLRALAHEFDSTVEVSVIPNGVDTLEFAPDDSHDRESGHILCVSRLVERKGVQHLIEAMPRVIQAVPSAHLTVVGEGNMDERLKRRCAETQLAESVHFLGYVNHEKLPGLYRKAQVLVQPSFFEGMSNTVLEAMASGLPIVVSGGGSEELYRNNAIHVPYGDQEHLAVALIELLSNERARAKMAKQSRQLALQYSWNAVANQYIELYKMTARRMDKNCAIYKQG